MNYSCDSSARTFLWTWEELTTYIHNWLKVINIALFLIYYSTLHSLKKKRKSVQKLQGSRSLEEHEIKWLWELIFITQQGGFMACMKGRPAFKPLNYKL